MEQITCNSPELLNLSFNDIFHRNNPTNPKNRLNIFPCITSQTNTTSCRRRRRCRWRLQRNSGRGRTEWWCWMQVAGTSMAKGSLRRAAATRAPHSIVVAGALRRRQGGADRGTLWAMKKNKLMRFRWHFKVFLWTILWNNKFKSSGELFCFILV